jgi:hypothetical protein
MAGFRRGAGRRTAAAPRRTKGFGARTFLRGAGLAAAREGLFAAFADVARFLADLRAVFRAGFFAFAGLRDFPADALVRFLPLRDAMCRMPEIAAGARLEKWATSIKDSTMDGGLSCC